MDDVKTGNRIISPDEFFRQAAEAMRKVEDEQGLARGAILRAWINESPMFRAAPQRKAGKHG